MRAVHCAVTGSTDADEALVDTEVTVPRPGPRDILVRVAAVSVNPIDTKVRRRTAPGSAAQILGWDASGTVAAVGSEVQYFAPGDAVWYAGDVTRPGSNAEFQVVDERIAGRLPRTLSEAEGAAMPLTSITAWELLFDRLRINEASRLLVIGAAGGVGSMAVQIAKRVAGCTVIGTASRPDSTAWVRSFGADAVVDHSEPLSAGLAAAGIPDVTHVASLTHSTQHFADAVAALAPQGAYGLIDDPAQPLDVNSMKRKSLSLHWESMFTRSLFGTADLARQHEILDTVADLVDEGSLRSTLAADFGPICADNLIRAHEQLESARTTGKIVLSGWP